MWTKREPGRSAPTASFIGFVRWRFGRLDPGGLAEFVREGVRSIRIPIGQLSSLTVSVFGHRDDLVPQIGDVFDDRVVIVGCLPVEDQIEVSVA